MRTEPRLPRICRTLGIALLVGVAACQDNPPAPASNPLSWSDVQLGEYYARQRNCFTCHQDETTNDPTNILSGQAYPRPGTMSYGPNLTPDPDTGLGSGWTNDQIIGAMRTGFDNGDQELCPIMPRFTDMSDTEANAIVAYLLSLKPISHDTPDSTCVFPDQPDGGTNDGGSGSNSIKTLNNL